MRESHKPSRSTALLLQSAAEFHLQCALYASLRVTRNLRNKSTPSLRKASKGCLFLCQQVEMYTQKPMHPGQACAKLWRQDVLDNSNQARLKVHRSKGFRALARARFDGSVGRQLHNIFHPSVVVYTKGPEEAMDANWAGRKRSADFGWQHTGSNGQHVRPSRQHLLWNWCISVSGSPFRAKRQNDIITSGAVHGSAGGGARQPAGAAGHPRREPGQRAAQLVAGRQLRGLARREGAARRGGRAVRPQAALYRLLQPRWCSCVKCKAAVGAVLCRGTAASHSLQPGAVRLLVLHLLPAQLN